MADSSSRPFMPSSTHERKSFEALSGPFSPLSDSSLAERDDRTRILIVEDSEDHSELLLRQLRKSNLDGPVKIIGDGQAAWHFLEQSCRSDELIAIFLDLHIPSLDGLQLLRKIRRHPELSSVSVIVISS